jgi:DNA-binding MarR family transcriptional regulator
LSSDRTLRRLQQVFSEDLKKLKPSSLRALTMIRDYHSITGRWPRAREVENRYGSRAVYEILDDARRSGWVEKIEIKEDKERIVIYRLTKIGETLVALGQELLERNRKEAVRKLLEELKPGIEALSILPWRRSEIENLALALADESVRFTQSILYDRYARDSIVRVDYRMLFEEAKSILKDAQNNEEQRRKLFSGTLRKFFKLFDRGGDSLAGETLSSRRRELEKRLEKLLKYSFLSQPRPVRVLMKLRVVKSLSSIIPPLIYFSGSMHLISLVIIIGLALYTAHIPGFIYMLMPILSYLLFIILLAIICVLIRIELRRRLG